MQELKSKYIEQGRREDAYALILYLDDYEACECHFVMNRGSMSSDYNELVEEGYVILEEIFL